MRLGNFLPRLGMQALDVLRGLGHATFFVVDLLRNSLSAISRPVSDDRADPCDRQSIFGDHSWRRAWRSDSFWRCRATTR